MTNKPDGGGAFPVDIDQSGMTLRDYFAGQALVGFCVPPILPEKEHPVHLSVQTRAILAYALADAMITEGAKK